MYSDPTGYCSSVAYFFATSGNVTKSNWSHWGVCVCRYYNKKCKSQTREQSVVGEGPGGYIGTFYALVECCYFVQLGTIPLGCVTFQRRDETVLLQQPVCILTLEIGHGRNSVGKKCAYNVQQVPTTLWKGYRTLKDRNERKDDLQQLLSTPATIG